MRLDHLAIWVDDLEAMREFYLRYFDVVSGSRYSNPSKGYTSYFLTFSGGGGRIELMRRPDIAENTNTPRAMVKGLAHISVTVGGKDRVDALTERFRNDGFVIASEPRTTGDGYYESAVLDPEGNQIEIVE